MRLFSYAVLAAVFILSPISAHAEFIEVSFEATVLDGPSAFAAGTVLEFVGQYDPDDIMNQGSIVFTESSDASLLVDGAAQSGVGFQVVNTGSQLALSVSWDGPPANPDAFLSFPVPVGDPLDLTGFDASFASDGFVNNDGNSFSDLMATSFSAFVVPEPGALALFVGSGILLAARRRRGLAD